MVLESFLKEIGFFKYVNEDVGLKGIGEENIRVFLEGIKFWEIINFNKGFKEYFEYIFFIFVFDFLDELMSYVLLMIVYVVKGFEFDNVFLVGMCENIFLNYRVYKVVEVMEEERRLVYVVIIRVKEKLFVSDFCGLFFYL